MRSSAASDVYKRQEGRGRSPPSPTPVPEPFPRAEPTSDEDGEEESEEVESDADGGPEYLEIWVPEGDWSRTAKCVFVHLDARGAAASPGPLIHAAMHSLIPGLRFEMTPSSHGVFLLRFLTCAEREAAVSLQPFSHEGVEIRLERVEVTEDPFVGTPEWLAHVVAWNFPEEHWDSARIRAVFGCVGTVMEIDPLCFPGPDRSSLRLVIELNNPHVPYRVGVHPPAGAVSSSA